MRDLESTNRDRTKNQAADQPLDIFGKTYLTPSLLARRLGVTTRTLTRWEDARTGPPRIKHGKMVLYDEAKLPGWLESLERSPLQSTTSKRRARA